MNEGEKKWKCKLLSCVLLFLTGWTVAHRLLCPWDSPSKNTLLQDSLPNQISNPGLLHWRQIPTMRAIREAGQDYFQDDSDMVILNGKEPRL